MNSQEMYTAINKGVPCYSIIELDVNTIINECAFDKQRLQEEMSLVKELYRSYFIERMGFVKAKEYFFDKFRIMTSFQNAESQIYISPIPYIEKLKRLLNLNNQSNDFNDEQLYKELMGRVELLKKITTSEELKMNFPLIYEDYLLAIDSYPKIKRYEMLHRNDDNEEIKNKINNQYRMFRLHGLHTLFDQFIKRQGQLYRNFVVRRQFIEGYANRHPLDFSMFTGLDKAKFELYLADKYLTKAIESTDDKEKQECVFYLATYIRETKVSDITIRNDQGKQISFDYIVRRYKKFLQQNHSIRPIDEPRENFKNYNVRHVINHVNKYFFTDVNWQIVPPGKEEELDREVIESLNRAYNYLSPEEREAKILERYRIYERKKHYFENSGYVHKIYGINTFAGYIAYIYPNGEILMEKYFDDQANCRPTQGEAIYNVKVADFERLSRLAKPVLMKEPTCARIIHRGEWEEKADIIVNRPATKETEESVKKLILELQTKRTK